MGSYKPKISGAEQFWRAGRRALCTTCLTHKVPYLPMLAQILVQPATLSSQPHSVSFLSPSSLAGLHFRFLAYCMPVLPGA